MKAWPTTAAVADSPSAQRTAKIIIDKKDVKNADRSGDMYENKGAHDKMAGEFRDFGRIIRRKYRIFEKSAPRARYQPEADARQRELPGARITRFKIQRFRIP
jgi:hypothetical protein